MNSVLLFLSVLFVGVRTMEMTCKIQGSPLPVMCDGDEMEMPAMKKVYSMIEDMEMEEKDERMETARYRQQRLAFEEEQDRESDAKFTELYMRVQKLEMKLKMKEQDMTEQDKDMEMYERKCAFNDEDYCYMIKTHTLQDVNYMDAMKMCEEHNAMIAFMPHENASNETLEKLWRAIPYGRDSISVWISSKVDPMTGESNKEGEYYCWAPDNGLKKESGRTAVIMSANNNKDKQGMYNVFENVYVHGVICRMEHE